MAIRRISSIDPQEGSAPGRRECWCSLRKAAVSTDRKKSAGCRNRRRCCARGSHETASLVSLLSTRENLRERTTMRQTVRRLLCGSHRNGRACFAGSVHGLRSATRRRGSRRCGFPQTCGTPGKSFQCSGGSGGSSVIATRIFSTSASVMRANSCFPCSAVAREG